MDEPHGSMEERTQKFFLKILGAGPENVDEDRVTEKERGWIRNGRAKGDESDPVIGLALSGGGIRSAAFNLGLLQALKSHGIYQKIDYLSTVSGGGYIGTCLTWFLSKTGVFPFGEKREDNAREPGKLARWLRLHGAYLIEGDGLSVASFVAVALRGILTNFLVLLPAFFLAVYLACLPIPFLEDAALPGFVKSLNPDIKVSGFFLIGLVGLIFLVILLGLYFGMALFSGIMHKIPYSLRRRLDVWLGRLLKWGSVFILIGSVPFAWDEVKDGGVFRTPILSSLNVVGIALLSIGWRARGQLLEKKRWVQIFLNVGALLLGYGVLLVLYGWAHAYHERGWTSFCYALVWFPALSATLFILGDVNRLSMHRYYRDRLMDAFMPSPGKFWTNQEASPDASDKFYLKDVPENQRPYHILNTFLVTPDSSDDLLRARGGENFIFSPLHCGSKNTEYVLTKEYLKGEVNLATAMAISGAALDPNVGSTRSKPLAFLMSLLNVRLGYWILNPRHPWKRNVVPSYVNLVRELFGWQMDEKKRYVHLSDGGHFENLGLYELIRRRCDGIIVSDAGADNDWKFDDLGRACELVRIDFGASIQIDTDPLQPDTESEVSPSPFVFGKVKYKDDGKEASLIFIKSNIFPNLPEDVRSYRRVHDDFPDQTTADQFFDERQFEAYRELGYRAAECAFRK